MSFLVVTSFVTFTSYKIMQIYYVSGLFTISLKIELFNFLYSAEKDGTKISNLFLFFHSKWNLIFSFSIPPRGLWIWYTAKSCTMRYSSSVHLKVLYHALLVINSPQSPVPCVTPHQFTSKSCTVLYSSSILIRSNWVLVQIVNCLRSECFSKYLHQNLLK